MSTEINVSTIANLVHSITDSNPASDLRSVAKVIAIQQPKAAATLDNSPEREEQTPKAKAKENNEQQEEKQEIESVVSDINDYVQTIRRELQFFVNDESGSTVVKVFNKETAELIRQIPSEDFLKLAKTMSEYRSTLLDEIV